MFQGTQGNINVSTSASTDEISLFNQLEMGDLKNFSNPIVGKMPFGHEGYTEADKEKCPVMSGMIKPPVQEENEDDDDTDSDSSGEEEEEEELEMPSGHGGYGDQDKDKCPVLSGKIKMPQRDGQGDTVNKKKKKKKIQSGCPFMPAETKKDPGLTHLEPSYEIPYISTLRHLFTFKGIGQKGKACPSNREKFDSYPIFLRHTLFHDQEKFSKVRKCEMTQKFFIYDNFREQGNKRYHKNKLDEAIALYEHGLSCFKWLEMKPEEKKEGDEEKKEDEYDALASLKPLNKALITVLSDDNVRLCDGEDVTEKSDIDLRTSMVLSAHLSLACCYLKLNHYSTAIIALEEGMKINNTSSQFYFRRSQARAYNKGSTLEDLYLAKEDIEKAIDMKHTEKLFQQEPSVLKILNVHNAGEIYVEHAHFVDKVIKEKKDEIKAGLKRFFSKIKEIEFVEEAMIQDGKVMNDTDRHTVEICADEDMEEFDLIKEMLSKYYKIIEFYIETDKKDQIKIARKEVQTVLEAYHKMKQLLSLDFKNYEKNPILVETANDFQIDLSKPKVQKRLDKMRINKVKDIFDNGHFNMEVFQYAYKDYSKKKQEKEKAQKEKAKKLEGAEKPKAGFLKTILGAEFGLQMLVLALLFALFWFWNKNRLSGADSVLSKGI